jgi:ABC-2 type transport system ATP-binding protein
MNAIETVHLRKEYKDVVAVEDLNLTVAEGELFSLLGINGAGKTTTLKLLSCLTRPTAGDAFLLGKSICKEPSAVKSLIAVSPQETAVAPGLTVYENLELMCGVYGKNKAKIPEMLTRLGLESVAKRKAGKLSGGWQRRLSIAMALISEPKILFLDEPTLGLDVLARSELWDLIRSMKGKITIIGCPKLDDIDYTEKLTAIIRSNNIQSVTIVRMEVPCCGGLQRATENALQASGKFIPWQVVTISRDGRILD